MAELHRDYGSVPRTRGDEPITEASTGNEEAVFPARAGMNRARCPRCSLPESVPRTRGDEPQYDTAQ